MAAIFILFYTAQQRRISKPSSDQRTTPHILIKKIIAKKRGYLQKKQYLCARILST